jgi:TP901-1 family phage major tail protein
MVAQKGKDLLIKIDQAGTGTYVTIAGLRSKRIAFNAETVDVTDADSAGRWRELLAESGTQRLSVSGSGIFKDAASDEALRGVFFAGALAPLQFIIPGFGTLAAPCQVTALEYGGSHDGEVTFEVAFESAGAVTFTGA